MQMLYEEMESSLASIYEVVGYFDIKHNETFSSQCLYLGSPESFADFMSGQTGIKHVFVPCRWRKDAIIFYNELL